MTPINPKTNFSPRQLFTTLLGLGLASGLPYMLTARTLRLWARSVEVDLSTIGLFSLVTLPYSYKFLWAPLMDRWSPLSGILPAMGRRRGWLLITQIVLILAIAGMGFSGPTSANSSLHLFVIFALIVSLASASQDVVADAYRTDISTPAQLGQAASLFSTGYRAALIASGAGAVFLAAYVSWLWVYLIIAAVMSLGLICTCFAPTPPGDAAAPRSLLEAFSEPLHEFVTRLGWKGILVVASFVFLFKIPDYMASTMTDPLLLDLGFDKKTIAIWGIGVGTAVTIPGAMIGGPLVTRLGLMRALLLFGIAHIASNAGYLVLAHVGNHNLVMIIVIGIEFFCMGMVAAGYMAFLMSQCNHRYSATQYALLTGLMSLSNVLAGTVSGFAADYYGYQGFFILSMYSGLPAILMIPLLPKTKK